MEETTREWRRCALDWTRRDSVLLFVETQRILTCAVCTWAGIPVSQSDQTRRSKDLASMVDAFGGVGPRLWRGKFARMRTEAWMRRMVQAARRGRVAVNGQSALAIMASHHGLDGRLLDARTAAVELINVIRPTVAISWYIAFAALALHEHPQCRERLLAETPGSSDYADLFMQEVRRFYPFAPFVGALVRRPFDWRGYRFEPGTLVLLDVYGTNHDPEVWSSPGEFKPERFRQWDGSAYNFIPQGGGDRMGHRCPGEWITMHNIVLALHFLTRALTYDIPDQDLTVDLSRMPTFPRSRLLLRNVRTTPMFHTQPPTLPSIIAAHDAASAESRGETGLEVYRTSGRHKRDAA